jgi:hypothetical protein
MPERSLPRSPALADSARSKRHFSAQEDAMLKTLVGEFGEDWVVVAGRIPSRNARQCKDRWTHYLSPEVSVIPWTAADDLLLLEKVRESGHRWAQIAKHFPMRTDVHIKNRFILLQRRERHHANRTYAPTGSDTNAERQRFPPLFSEGPFLGISARATAEENTDTATDIAVRAAERPFSIREIINP